MTQRQENSMDFDNLHRWMDNRVNLVSSTILDYYSNVCLYPILASSWPLFQRYRQYLLSSTRQLNTPIIETYPRTRENSIHTIPKEINWGQFGGN